MGSKAPTDDWASLSFAKKSRALGVSEKTLSTWKGLGAPIDAGREAVTQWRASNVAPRNGGLPSRRGQPVESPSELLSQAFEWYLTDSKKTFDLIDAMRALARDRSLTADESADINRRLGCLVTSTLFALWLRHPRNSECFEICNTMGEVGEDQAFEAFADSTMAELLSA